MRPYLFPAALLLTCAVHAQQLVLDPAYGDTGIAAVPPMVDDSYSSSAVLTADDHLYVLGTGTPGPTLARFDANGDLDPSFGVNGVVNSTVPCAPSCILEQADGRILVGGQSSGQDMMVLRFLAGGDLDTSFGEQGVLSTPGPWTAYSRVHDMAVDPEGRILTAGSGSSGFGTYYLSVRRYFDDGTPDTTFGIDNGEFYAAGSPIAGAFNLLRRPDGKWLAAGSNGNSSHNDPLFIPLTADGLYDFDFAMGQGFHPPGIANGLIYDLAMDTQGRVLYAGYGSTLSDDPKSFMVGRMSVDGVADPDFGTAGVQLVNTNGFDNTALNIVVRPDGRLLLGGTAQVDAIDRSTVVALTPDGQLDAGFANSGSFTIDWGFGQHCKVLLQGDGKLLLTAFRVDAGDTWLQHMLVGRYIEDSGTHLPPRPQAGALNVFPNPAAGPVVITGLGAYPMERVQLLSATGQLVMDLTQGSRSAEGTLRLDLGGAPPGCYVLVLTGNGQRRTVPVLMRY